MLHINLFRASNKFCKPLLTAVLIVIGANISRAQNAGSDPVMLRQEMDRLRKIEELQRQINELSNYGRTQEAAQTPQSAVSLYPVDTGKSVVTFDLSGGTDQAFDHFAIKSNLLYFIGTVTPNLGFDVGLGAKTSIGMLVGYNNWGNLWDNSATGPEYDEKNFYRRRLDHVYGKIEFRYWFRRRFKGSFIGANAIFADYNIGEVSLKPVFDKRYNHVGNVYGAGLSYGYLWRWSPRWGMEFTLGMGVAVLEYDRNFIEIGTDGFTLIDRERYRDTYVGPTNIGISMVFNL